MKTNTPLSRLRQSKGFNQLGIALEVGCCLNTIKKIERGYIDTTQMGLVKAYCDVLGLSLDEVWELGKV